MAAARAAALSSLVQKCIEDDFKLAGFTNAMLAVATPHRPYRSASRVNASSASSALGQQTALPITVLDFADQSKIDAAFAQGVAEGQHPQAF